MHIYVARTAVPRSAAARCPPTAGSCARRSGAPRPAVGADPAHRARRPRTHVHGHPATRPRARSHDRDLRNGRFGPEHIRVPLGTRVRWRFQDASGTTCASPTGPPLWFTPTLGAGATRVSRFRLPGRYELFCTLHPVTMHEVRRRAGTRRRVTFERHVRTGTPRDLLGRAGDGHPRRALDVPHPARVASTGCGGSPTCSATSASRATSSPARLQTLTGAGILERRRYQQEPERFEYRLTEQGRDLYPAIIAIMRWGEEHLAADGRRSSCTTAAARSRIPCSCARTAGSRCTRTTSRPSPRAVNPPRTRPFSLQR